MTPPAAGASGTEESRQAALEERTRIREITGLCSRFGMDPEEYISRGDTLEQVRKAVLDRLERNGAPISVRVNEDEADKRDRGWNPAQKWDPGGETRRRRRGFSGSFPPDDRSELSGR